MKGLTERLRSERKTLWEGLRDRRADVDCDHCGAQTGDPCRTKTGRIASRSHGARQQQSDKVARDLAVAPLKAYCESCDRIKAAEPVISTWTGRLHCGECYAVIDFMSLAELISPRQKSHCFICGLDHGGTPCRTALKEARRQGRTP